MMSDHVAPAPPEPRRSPMLHTRPAADGRNALLWSVPPTLLIVVLNLAGGVLRGEALPVEAVLASLIGFYCLTVLLAFLSRNLPWRLRTRIAALFVLTFAVMTLNTGIELQIFSTLDAAALARYYANGLWRLGLYVAAVAFLFPPRRADVSFTATLGRHLARRPWYAWAWRIPAAMLVYVVLYFIVGAVAYIFTEPYYTDPAYGLNLLIPSVDLVFKVQLIRAPIYILALAGLVVGLGGSRFKVGVLAGLALFLLGGFTPLLSNYEWPAALRFYHTVEILFQNFPSGLLMVLLLRPSLDASSASTP